jgi:hypothetical protein
MSYSPTELLTIAGNYEKVAAKKEKKKLDPKAKNRNRGTVCVPAASAKDKQDHFPINSEGQARNALARVHQYSSAPEWYKGSLSGLQALVSRKVHSKYPGIKIEKKKSSEVIENLLTKYGQEAPGPIPEPPKPGTPEDTPEARAKWNEEMRRREEVTNQKIKEKEDSIEFYKKYWSTDPADAQKTKAHPEKYFREPTTDLLKRNPNVPNTTPVKKASILEVNLTSLKKYAQAGPDFFTSQNAFWKPANQLIQLSYSLGDANIGNDLKAVITDVVEKATDVRDKGVSGEFNPETVASEMKKYLGNFPGSQLKMAMDKIEQKAEGAKALITGRSGFDQFRQMMRPLMAQIFTAGQNMIDAAVAEATAKAGAGTNITPTSGMGQGQSGNVATPNTPAGPPTPRSGNPQIANIQKALNRMGIRGSDGKPLDVDGIRGKNTNFAIEGYKQEHGLGANYTDNMVFEMIMNPNTPPGYATPGKPAGVTAGIIDQLVKKYG